MSSTVFHTLYERLLSSVPDDDTALVGLKAAVGSGCWVAIDSSSFPSLLLAADQSDFRPDIVLRSVQALFSRSCAVKAESGRVHEGCYTVIKLTESDPAVVRLFLSILESQFCGPVPAGSNAEIASKIQQVAALFSAPDHDKRDLTGLWGELHLIAASKDICAAVECWATQRTAKYDFVSTDFVLDVKTTTQSQRRHRFSLEQVRPRGKAEAFIASIAAVEIGDGRTVGSLIDHIAERLGNQDMRASFLTQCLAKGGRDVYRSQLALRPNPALGGLAFYRAADIPAPMVEAGDPISQVRFETDLAQVKHLGEKQISRLLQFQREVPKDERICRATRSIKT